MYELLPRRNCLTTNPADELWICLNKFHSSDALSIPNFGTIALYQLIDVDDLAL